MNSCTTVPYESSVQVTKPVLVGLCDVGDHGDFAFIVEEPYPGPRHTCEFEHDWQPWAAKKYGNGETRGLKKRLAWKCPVCSAYYMTRAALLDHEHQYFY